jgi:large subunit ribosomal protein L12
MEYVYGAMLLHSAGKEVNEENLSKVLEAAGIGIEDARVKALTASLDGVDIEDVIASAAAVPAAAAPAAAPAEAGGSEETEVAEEEEEEVSEEEVEEGLGALFG